MGEPPEYRLNDGETLGYDKNIDSVCKLLLFLKTIRPKRKKASKGHSHGVH